jgi:spore coat polysaccharide biosynthesis predicted glycosyltransferase SpsG
VSAPGGLADLLSSVSVAVVGGGVTLAEACALGTPTVAVPVVDAQRPAIAAAAAAGAAIPVFKRTPRAAASSAAELVCELIGNRRLALSLASRGSRLVDGGGAARVAALLRELGRPQAGGRYAA